MPGQVLRLLTILLALSPAIAVAQNTNVAFAGLKTDSSQPVQVKSAVPSA